MTQPQPITFGELGLSDAVLGILKAKKFITPTPIQEKCIPLAMQGSDIVGIAQTGTGKTLAFGLPAIEQILAKKGRCLILLPTRELALQVNEVLVGLGRQFGLKITKVIGGLSAHQQKMELRQNPNIIIATPGRLIDHMHQKNCSLNTISIVVLDEADRMLDIGFMPQIKEILKATPETRQTMLFSATMPKEIESLAMTYMKTPTRIEITPSGSSSHAITQEAYIISSQKKQELLQQVLESSDGSTLIFTRTKFRTKKLTAHLREIGYSATEIHSNRTLSQRTQSLNGFKSGRYKILVATDVAARGLHIDDISLVINLDLPDNQEDYVHRIGRTGRAGKTGRALSFIEPDQKIKLTKIERLIKKTITILEGSEDFSRHQVDDFENRQNRNRKWSEKRQFKKPSGSRAWDKEKSSTSKPWDKKKSSASKPWDKEKSSTSKPWDKEKSSASKPWDKEKSSASKPWDKEKSSASKPWDKEKSSTSKPWDKEKSSTSKPWDKEGARPRSNSGNKFYSRKAKQQ